MGGVTHLRGQTPETLVQAFPGLAPPVARRVVHRLVGEHRDDLDGVPGLSKARAARAARARGASTGSRSSTGGAATSTRSSSTCSAPATVACSSRCASRSSGRASASASRRRSAARSAAASARPGGSASSATSSRGRWSSRCCESARESPERPTTGVVFQGQGEPLQNYDNVMQAASVLRHPCGARIGGRPHHDLDRRAAAAARALHRGAPAVSADPVADLGVLREARAAGADHRALRGRGAGGGGAPAGGGSRRARAARVGADLRLQHRRPRKRASWRASSAACASGCR